MNPSKKQQNCENCNLLSNSLIAEDSKNFRKNHANKDKGELLVCERCHEHFSLRNASSEDILTSDADKRLIVAGPGTGKTFTFGQVINKLKDGSSALVFTLINNLASELEEDLSKIENKDVKANTFHGYCKELLHSKVRSSDLTKDFSYTPHLPSLIESDASLLNLNFTEEIFSKAFANIDDGAELQFYLNRASYYDSVSHIDSVYRVYKFFEGNKDKIPEYGIVIADEYQDFNKLESEFIALLSTKSKILLAGDDDQALYGFRGAKKDFIRNLHNDVPEYHNKYLPYCSRCTPVIVDSTNAVVIAAQSIGRLNDRIPRDFTAYWPDKYKEHALHPNMYVARCSQFSTVAKYTEARILELTQNETISAEDDDLPFMIIGPESGYHLNQIKTYLLETLDSEIFEVIDSRNKNTELEISEGYELLRTTKNRNLGWRIVLYIDPVDNLAEIIKTSYEKEQDLEELLPPEYIKKHIDIISKEPETEEEEENSTEETKKIQILVTHFLGSKGLSALHTIIVGLNNYTFPSTPTTITDEDVCKFIVALTRARNSCVLVTNKEWNRGSGITVDRPSTFLTWLIQDKLSSKRYRVRGNNLEEY